MPSSILCCLLRRHALSLVPADAPSNTCNLGIPCPPPPSRLMHSATWKQAPHANRGRSVLIVQNAAHASPVLTSQSMFSHNLSTNHCQAAASGPGPAPVLPTTQCRMHVMQAQRTGVEALGRVTAGRLLHCAAWARAASGCALPDSSWHIATPPQCLPTHALIGTRHLPP